MIRPAKPMTMMKLITITTTSISLGMWIEDVASQAAATRQFSRS